MCLPGNQLPRLNCPGTEAAATVVHKAGLLLNLVIELGTIHLMVLVLQTCRVQELQGHGVGVGQDAEGKVLGAR